MFHENQHRSRNATRTIIIESSGYTAQSRDWSPVGLKRCNFFLKINPVPRRDKSVLIKYWAPDGCYLFSFVPLFIRPYPISSPIYAPRYRIRSSDIQLLFRERSNHRVAREIEIFRQLANVPSTCSQTSLFHSPFVSSYPEKERDRSKPLLSFSLRNFPKHRSNSPSQLSPSWWFNKLEYLTRSEKNQRPFNPSLPLKVH